MCLLKRAFGEHSEEKDLGVFLCNLKSGMLRRELQAVLFAISISHSGLTFFLDESSFEYATDIGVSQVTG